MYKCGLFFMGILLAATPILWADVVLDNFENDKAPTNGPGTDAGWNLPPVPPFQVAFEPQAVQAGSGALKVTWTNKDLWPNFVIGRLDQNQNAGSQFENAEAVRMAIRGPAGRIIIKLADAANTTTGDVASVETSGSDTYEMYEFSLSGASGSAVDLTKVSEIWVLMDAGVSGTSGTVYIDSIELINGTGADAEVVAVIDNFDNDNSLADDPNAPDSVPSGNTLLAGPYVTQVVNDPAGAANSVLKVDYKTSMWNVLWVTEMDVTDWSNVTGISIDVYGTAPGILLKFKDASGKEQEPSGGAQDHEGNQWDTLTWDSTTVGNIDTSKMGRLIIFVAGPTGGSGTVYFDNLTLTGEAPLRIEEWELH